MAATAPQVQRDVVQACSGDPALGTPPQPGGSRVLGARPCAPVPPPAAGPRGRTPTAHSTLGRSVPRAGARPGLTLVQQLVEEQSAGEEEEVGQHLGGDLGVHLELPQEVQGGLVDGHDAAQLLGQRGRRAPAPPALRLERGAFQQAREAGVQALGRQGAALRPRSVRGRSPRATRPHGHSRGAPGPRG